MTGIVFLISNRQFTWFDDKDVTVITSLVALLISIISLAIADQKSKRFKGRLEVSNFGGKNSYGHYQCRFTLSNTDKEPLVNIKLDFRYPSIVYSPGTSDPRYFHYTKLEQATIVNEDNYRFIGTSAENNFAEFEHWLALERMTSAAFITVHADRMEVKTFVLTVEVARRLSEEEGKVVTINT